MRSATCGGRLGLTILTLATWAAATALGDDGPAAGPPAGLSADRLRCEYLADPSGIDATEPRLSWQVQASRRDQKQTAYRVLVASRKDLLAADRGDLWDSGKVAGDATTQVVYAGQTLTSRRRCFWKVKVWDKQGQPSAWSDPASWSMGLLGPDDWQARFISFRDETPVPADPQTHCLPPARHYRKPFEASKTVRRATIYATALGIYELHLNGRRVGDALFAPGWCDYRKRLYYNTYDVTGLVQPGANALGAIVADGWYSGYVGFGLLVGFGPNKVGRCLYGKTPALLVQLELEYDDGSREIVGSDPTWKVTGDGPLRQADFLMGEFYDARREMPDWAQPAFDDGGWQSAIEAEDNGSTEATFHDAAGPREVELGFVRPERLQAYPAQPVRPIEEIKPVEITSPEEGVYIYNLGQNFAGFVRLKVRGPRDTQVRLRFGEMLHPDGRLMTENLRKARAHDYYVLRGDPQGETYVPRFTFHGFQYVEVTGYPGKPDLDAITGVVVHSDTPLASSFECSDPMVNRLFRNIVWTQRANFLELPTDCPQRDERMGWTGDAQIYIRAATYNADVGAFYTKWLQDLEESQRPSGAFPGYAPFPMQHGEEFGTAWMDAGVICPYTIYQVYGDTRVIRRHYASMKRFMDFRRRAADGFLGVEHGNAWGDWLAVNEHTPLDYIDTIYFGYSAKLMAEMAAAIDEESDAAEYRRLFENIQKAFAEKYVKSDGTLTVDTQTAYALALFAELMPENLRVAAGAHLAAKIRDNDHRMATGFLGTRPLLPVLSSVGQHDLAARLLQSREYPSWGYEIVNGATTIWERWNSYTKDKGFGDAAMNSFAHYSFGAVCEWMFQTLAGIDTDGIGFRRIVIRPTPPSPESNPDHRPIDWVKASYDSLHGRIRSAWKQTAGRFELTVVVPANVTATVYLPARDAASVTESGRSLDQAEGVRLLRMDGDRAVLAVGSGTYRFAAATR
ncbi:MAG: glycoside hydrolase family 78 protein [Pirellulales bacterium]|nr:glycoside hydrolase family 78 protein [Pirellulales bacterium]